MTGVGYNVVGRSEYVRKVESVRVAFCWRYPGQSVRNVVQQRERGTRTFSSIHPEDLIVL